MESQKTRAFWAARLKGADSDLNDWEQTLSEPFFPRVMRLPINNELVLRSDEFDAMTAAFEVRERARIIIDDLNGAMRATSGSNRIEFNGVSEVLSDGTTNETLFVEAAQIIAKGGQVAVVTTGGTPSPPQPSTAQKWVRAAASNDIVADMLLHFGGEPSWYNLYKTYEGVRGLSRATGGLDKKQWAPAKDVIDRFTHTANFYRHALPHPARTIPPADPMPFKDATDLVRGLVNAIMSEVAP